MAVSILQMTHTLIERYLNIYFISWEKISVNDWLIMGFTKLAGMVVTGFYPAYILLKNENKKIFNKRIDNKKGLSISGIFTVVQFTAATVILVWIFIVNRQLDFIFHHDIGYDHKAVLVVDLPIIQQEQMNQKIDAFTQAATKIAGVNSYTVSQSVPGDNSQGYIGMRRNTDNPGIMVESNGIVDENFIPFFNLKMLAGHNFLPDNPADQNSIILSESATARLGFKKPEDAVGDYLYNGKTTIIGVIKDYKLRPFLNMGYQNYNGNGGEALTYRYNQFSSQRVQKVSFRIYRGDIQNIISSLQTIYKNTFNDDPFSWSFLDDMLNKRYQKQITARNQIFVFSLIAMVIAIIGLLASISYKIVERTKEIGIRKILGARMREIGGILVRPTLGHISMAVLLSIPVAWFLGKKYLEYFTQQINMQWWYFLIPVSILLFILFSAVTVILIKATRINPVKELRYE